MRIDNRSCKPFTLAALVGVTALALAGTPTRGQDGPFAPGVFTLVPSTHGNPEGVAYDPRTGAFFVSATGDGTIYRGTLDGDTAVEFIAGAAGRQAAGLDVWQGQLYVAGAFLGDVRVYDIDSGALVASFQTGEGGMINDLVVTPRGDVYATDSFRPVLWFLTAGQVEAGGGTPAAIPLDPEIVYDPNNFNVNGIVALQDGHRLIVVQSSTGKLFRIDLDEQATHGREIREIALNETVFGDGLLIDQGRLVAVTFAPAGLAIVNLDGQSTSGAVVERIAHPSIADPSTVALARNLYLVVNADFLTSTPPFTVAALPRNSGGSE